jgi:hypothetical protein
MSNVLCPRHARASQPHEGAPPRRRFRAGWPEVARLFQNLLLPMKSRHAARPHEPAVISFVLRRRTALVIGSWRRRVPTDCARWTPRSDRPFGRRARCNPPHTSSAPRRHRLDTRSSAHRGSTGRARARTSTGISYSGRESCHDLSDAAARLGAARPIACSYRCP